MGAGKDGDGGAEDVEEVWECGDGGGRRGEPRHGVRDESCVGGVAATKIRAVRICRVEVSNFRCFPSRVSLDLAPLTLLYGWNNAGKSALVRLLAMVGEAVAESAASPLDPGVLGASEGGFASLRWKGNPDLTEQVGIRLGLSWDDAPGVASVAYELNYDDARRLTVVTSAEVVADDGARTRFEANPVTQRYDQMEPEPVSETHESGLSFAGLVPNGEPRLDSLRAVLVEMRGRVQWLTGVRARPPRLMSPTGASPRRLGRDGSGAVEVLLANDAVRARVAKWYANASQRELVLTDALQGGHRTLLRPLRSTMDVDLVDAGEGMVQCLPVVTAAAMMERPEGPRVLTVEEPESHLHPRAQRHLAEFLCEVAGCGTRPTVIAETHSFAMMLGVQLAIAQGKARAEDVVAYWLEPREDGISTVRKVRFDKTGRAIDAGFLGVFAEETDLSQALADLQMFA